MGGSERKKTEIKAKYGKDLRDKGGGKTDNCDWKCESGKVNSEKSGIMMPVESKW